MIGHVEFELVVQVRGWSHPDTVPVVVCSWHIHTIVLWPSLESKVCAVLVLRRTARIEVSPVGIG